MEILRNAAGGLIFGVGAVEAFIGGHLLWEAATPLPSHTSEFQQASGSIQAELGMPEVSAAANAMYTTENARNNIRDIDKSLRYIDYRPLGTILLLSGAATMAAGVASVNIRRR